MQTDTVQISEPMYDKDLESVDGPIRTATDDTGPTDGHDTPAPCFRVLGLLQVHGREQVLITARRQQVVLALLLLNGNRVVPLESLLDALWGSAPPATARAQVQTCVSALRRCLAQAGLGERISVRGLGYTIDIARDELDLHVFDDLVVRGRAELAARHPEAARAAFRAALALWRGEPLSGIDSGVVRANRVRIAERRVEVLEDCIDAELRLGLHSEVVGEISAMVAEHPLRERFVEQLMTALYRCGRRVEALATYRSVRQTFVGELGLEPSPSMSRLHQDILNGSLPGCPKASPPEPVPSTPRSGVGMPVPRMLPARVPGFTGCAPLLDALRGKLVAEARPDAAPVAVLTGTAGVGKSAVAIEVAHEVAAEFPDGQLYACLTDRSGRPENVADVLERFLRALGFAASEVPADLEGRAALYRSALAGRRLLTVIEDVTDQAQVQPLVPGTPTCRLVMTTRARTAALPGSIVFELAALDIQDGVELLTATVGPARVRAELAQARELVGLCGGLQRALAGVAAQLNARPHWTFEHIVARLRDERHRLDQLSDLGIDVRVTLERQYLGLPSTAKRLFTRLGLLRTDSWAGWLAAPLLDIDADLAADAVDALVDARLVDVVGGVGDTVRYRLPELAAIHARDLLSVTEPAQRQAAALHRVFGALLWLTDGVRARHNGNQVDTGTDAARWPLPRTVLDTALADPSAWYERERATLLAGVRQAAASGAVEHCWQLAVAVADLAGVQSRFADWRASGECALRATRDAGDHLGETTVQYLLDELDRRENRRFDTIARITDPPGGFEHATESGWPELARQVSPLAEWTRTEPASWPITASGDARGERQDIGYRASARRNRFELVSSTDSPRVDGTHHDSVHTDSAARGAGRPGNRRMPRLRSAPWGKGHEA